MTTHPVFPPQLPLLRCPNNDLQIGTSPAVRLTAPPQAEQALRALNGTCSAAHAAATFAVDASWLRAAIHIAQKSGLIPTPITAPVRVLGSGMIADAIRTEFRDRAIPQAPDTDSANLVVVATACASPDRVALAQFMRDDKPHLIVSATQSGVCIGPFVIPGVTTCQRCCDLSVTARLPDWPHLAAQLSRFKPRLRPSVASWAACMAAGHVQAFLRDAAPDSANATWDLTDSGVEVRHWRMHPECGCDGMRVDHVSYHAHARTLLAA